MARMRWSPAVALVSLLAATPAAATTFLAASVEEIARSSEAVVRGRVVATAARATDDGRIVTDVDVAVASAWKGATEDTVRLVVPGGSLGWIALRVEGAPTFEPGEEVVVFAGREGRAWRVNGYALGKYRVVRGEARPALSGATVRPRALSAGERGVGPMPVAELERRVRGAR
jgi:hypothetical protein